jgi:hypothetical protein
MLHRRIVVLFCTFAMIMSQPAFGAEGVEDKAIEPKAGKILGEMCAYLESLEQFTFHAEITEDEILSSGMKLQFARAADASVRRPDRFRANGTGDRVGQQMFYDGKSITLYDKGKNYFGTIVAPSNIDEALDHAIQTFSLTAPLSDLMYSNPCERIIENIESGFYVGLHYVHGVKCHHLAFSQEDIDWQVWIEEGKTPLLRKVIITEKRVAGAPQFTALLSQWNVNPELPDSLFIFEVPEGAKKIEFLPADEGKAPK